MIATGNKIVHDKKNQALDLKKKKIKFKTANTCMFKTHTHTHTQKKKKRDLKFEIKSMIKIP